MIIIIQNFIYIFHDLHTALVTMSNLNLEPEFKAEEYFLEAVQFESSKMTKQEWQKNSGGGGTAELLQGEARVPWNFL